MTGRPGFDSVIMVDWSGGNQRLVRPCKDAIWIGVAGHDAVYCRHRGIAEAWLTDRMEAALTQGHRLLIGFDFPFGYPLGFGAALTGSDDPFSIWAWFADRIEDAPKANNRLEVAAGINRALGEGIGPFWANPSRRDIPGLPRTKTRYANPFPDRRACEMRAKGSFTCWQLAGAGAVGSQVLVGLPVLYRLRARFPGKVSVAGFNTPDTQIVFAEVWPGLIEPAVKAHTGPEDIRDAVQVRVLSDALSRLHPDLLWAMLSEAPGPEGTILGLGHERDLIAACH